LYVFAFYNNDMLTFYGNLLNSYLKQGYTKYMGTMRTSLPTRKNRAIIPLFLRYQHE